MSLLLHATDFVIPSIKSPDKTECSMEVDFIPPTITHGVSHTLEVNRKEAISVNTVLYCNGSPQKHLATVYIEGRSQIAELHAYLGYVLSELDRGKK